MTDTTTRRRVLLGLGAACTAATAAPELGAAMRAENPDLLALADGLPAVLGAYKAAAKHVAEIVAHWGPQWPKPDPQIYTYRGGSKPYRDIEGRGVPVLHPYLGKDYVPELGTPEGFEAAWKQCEAEILRISATKSKRGLKSAQIWAARDKALIAPARAYWAEVERIETASGFDAAEAAKGKARDALRAHVTATMAAPETTIAGVVIKAEALTAWANVDTFERRFNPKGPDWAEGLAAAIMRHGGAA